MEQFFYLIEEFTQQFVEDNQNVIYYDNISLYSIITSSMAAN